MTRRSSAFPPIPITIIYIITIIIHLQPQNTVCGIDELDIMERRYMPEIEKFEHEIRPIQLGKPIEIVKEEEQRDDIRGGQIRRVLQVGEEIKDSSNGQVLGRLKEDWIQGDPKSPPVKHVVEDIPPKNVHIHEHIGGKEFEQIQKLSNMAAGFTGPPTLDLTRLQTLKNEKSYNRDPLFIPNLNVVRQAVI